MSEPFHEGDYEVGKVATVTVEVWDVDDCLVGYQDCVLHEDADTAVVVMVTFPTGPALVRRVRINSSVLGTVTDWTCGRGQEEWREGIKVAFTRCNTDDPDAHDCRGD